MKAETLGGQDLGACKYSHNLYLTGLTCVTSFQEIFAYFNKCDFPLSLKDEA